MLKAGGGEIEDPSHRGMSEACAFHTSPNQRSAPTGPRGHTHMTSTPSVTCTRCCTPAPAPLYCIGFGLLWAGIYNPPAPRHAPALTGASSLSTASASGPIREIWAVRSLTSWTCGVCVCEGQHPEEKRCVWQSPGGEVKH